MKHTRSANSNRIMPIFVVASALCGLLIGCKSEERVVAARGGLYGLPGAQSGIIEDSESNSKKPSASQTAGGPWDNVLRAFPGYEETTVAPVTEDSAAGPQSRGEMLGLRRTNHDGSVTLFSRTPSDVMYHVMTTLENKEHDLLFDQVLSESTKAEYRRRGRDPRESVDFLVKRRADIAALFATFPMGDQTPGVLMKSMGRNTFRLTAPVAMSQELRLHSLDVIIENGQFRLKLIR